MDHNAFISELERCILADSSSPPELTPTYSSDELAEMYLNGEFNDVDESEYDSEYDSVDGEDDEDLIQIIYIDDSNFAKLDEEEIKNFIHSLSTILGAEPYSEEEVKKFISQSKKPKD